MSDERPSPEKLLDAIKKEESQGKIGRLKIFFGMSAGVGKTYAMLSEAQELQREGVDVVVGTVDTHGREETSLLLEGLKIIPEKIVEYKGKEFKELDLDGIIRLRPELVLVDELAHSNIPGLRHAKRWQDVLEILDAGIDVYTTLNVQHVESLNDIVRGITEVSVRETVPDLIIEKAYSIQLVDLTPDELLVRLKEGKVYLGDQSRVAALNFFQKDKLAALREIALRYAAEKVDRDLRSSIPTSEGVFEWKPREKFLVAVSSSPHSAKLIRTTRRIASNNRAPWMAVYVNDGRTLNEKDSQQLAQNLQLARDLGAEVDTINDPNVVDGIERIARQKGVTQIVLGRTPKNPFFNFFRTSHILDRLSTECTDIDVHVIRQDHTSKIYRKKFFTFPIFKEQLTSYIYVFFHVCLLTGINWLLFPFIGYKVVGVIFLIGILALSLFFKKGPVFFASILYAIAWIVFFMPTIGEFGVSSNEDAALLVLYVLTAIITGILADRAREHQALLVKGEAFARALNDISQQMAMAPSTAVLLKSVKEHLSKTFKGEFEILVKTEDDGLSLDKPISLLPDDYEKAAALWVFDKGKEAGWSTDTLPSSKNFYIPLKGFQEVVGVLVFHPQTNTPLSLEEKNFLYTTCRLLAAYLERVLTEEHKKHDEQQKQIDAIHKTILVRLSHEFELPLKIAQNAINKWKNALSLTGKPEELTALHEVEISFDAFRKILINISAMSLLLRGTISIQKSPHNVKQIMEEWCNNVKSGQVKVKVQEDLPQVSLDSNLINMLLYNLIMNALEFSPPMSTIEVEAKRCDNFLVLSVSDKGKGIPDDQLNFIFEKFYRLPDATSPGVGLGLAIAKKIAEAHQGFLKAENLSPQGAKFSLFLPIES